jgi:hypothetical protein
VSLESGEWFKPPSGKSPFVSTSSQEENQMMDPEKRKKGLINLSLGRSRQVTLLPLSPPSRGALLLLLKRVGLLISLQVHKVLPIPGPDEQNTLILKPFPRTQTGKGRLENEMRSELIG